MRIKQYILIHLLLLPLLIHSQNLEKIGAKNAFNINGGLDYTFLMATAHNKILQRDPFNMLISGSCTFTYLDFSLPFSFSYSNKSISYTQPFNRLQFAPTYKWIKLKFGNINQQHSKYTLDGINLKGALMELSPKNWKINLVYGKVADGVIVNDGFSNSIPFLERNFQAFSVSNQGLNYRIQFDVLRAKDQFKNGIQSNYMNPEENIAWGLNYNCVINKKTNIDLLQGFSIYTENNLIVSENYKSVKNFISINNTTRFDKALQIVLNHKFKHLDLGLSYEHIDPEYKTLGTYFFQNNLRNISLRSNFRLKKIIQIKFSVGIQENDFKNHGNSKNYRNTGTISMNYSSNKKYFLQGSYSNFSNITNRNPIYDPNQFLIMPDTLNFYQIQQNGNIVFNININPNFRFSFQNNYTSSSQLISDKFKPTFYGSTNNIRSINNLVGVSKNSKSKKHGLQLNIGNNLIFRENLITMNFLSNLKYVLKFKNGLMSTFGSNTNYMISKNQIIISYFLGVTHNLKIPKTDNQLLKLNFRFQAQQIVHDTSLETGSTLSLSYNF